MRRVAWSPSADRDDGAVDDIPNIAAGEFDEGVGSDAGLEPDIIPDLLEDRELK